MKRKILVLTASRAEYSRYRSVLAAIKQCEDLELLLVVAGAHLLERFGQSICDIEKDGFEIHDRIYQNVEGENLVTMAKSTGHTIVELSSVMDRLKPDVALVMGDRFEALAFATTAAMMNVRVAHIQGGEVSGTIDESIRHAITKLAHFHFPSTQLSAERIIRMGEDHSRIHTVGCPAVDTLLSINTGKQDGWLNAIEPYIKIDDRPDKEAPFLLVLHHPVTTEYEKNREQVEYILEAIKTLGMQTIMLWPNLDAGSDEISLGIRHYLINNQIEKLFMFKHFPMEVFTKLLAHTTCLVGNSSAGIREACYFGTPVVDIGTRQHCRERGRNVLQVMSGADEIVAAIKTQINKKRYPIQRLFGEGGTGSKIAEVLAQMELGSPQKRINY